MTPELREVKRRAGAMGGRATLAKYGREYMQAIGRRGAAALWRRYALYPYELSKYALVDRATGKIQAIR